MVTGRGGGLVQKYTRVYPEVSGLSYTGINNNKNRHSLRSNLKGYDSETH
jgi:hypothetical protein